MEGSSQSFQERLKLLKDPPADQGFPFKIDHSFPSQRQGRMVQADTLHPSGLAGSLTTTWALAHWSSCGNSLARPEYVNRLLRPPPQPPLRASSASQPPETPQVCELNAQRTAFSRGKKSEVCVSPKCVLNQPLFSLRVCLLVQGGEVTLIVLPPLCSLSSALHW